MVTRDKKKELVESMMSEYGLKIGGEECRKTLQGILLEDTSGGKLYKYRAFDQKGYALKNLESQTIHCSKSSVFNDPFECKIAIDLNSMYEALCGSDQDRIMDIYNEYVEVTQGKRKINELPSDVQIVLKRWMDDKEICKFIKDINSANVPQKSFTSYMTDNWRIMCRLMNLSILDDKTQEQFSKVEESSSTLIKKLTPN